MIPYIIHQIYWDLGNGNIEYNDIFYNSHQLFKSIDGFKYKLWDKSSCDNLIQTKFSALAYNFYMNLRYDIQRIDFARMCILYEYGGIYFDLDMIPIREFDNLLNRDFLFHNIRYIRPNYSYIENDIMGSVKHHPFWLELIDYCQKEYNIKSQMNIYNVWKGRFVLQTTGPKLLSRFIKKHYSYIKPMKLVYTKWNRDTMKGYYFKDLTLNMWVNTIN